MSVLIIVNHLLNKKFEEEKEIYTLITQAINKLMLDDTIDYDILVIKAYLLDAQFLTNGTRKYFEDKLRVLERYNRYVKENRDDK